MAESITKDICYMSEWYRTLFCLFSFDLIQFEHFHTFEIFKLAYFEATFKREKWQL